MLEVESISEEIIKKLGAHLESGMSSLSDVIYEFPSGNVQLSLPSLSVITLGTVDFTPEMNPYIHEQAETEDHQADVQYVVGKYDIRLQLDLWCRNKEERNDLYQEFFTAFNSQFPKMGLALTLTDYYNVICRYDLTSFAKEDSEVASQTGEWRIKMEIIANCDAIIEKEEYIMESLESHTEIPHGVEEEEDI